MRGAILDEGEKYHTHMAKVFAAIKNAQKNYNWLITDAVCYPRTPSIKNLFDVKYCWLSGDELTQIVATEDFQWIWAVLSGFEKRVSLNEVLEYPLPYADGYGGFWQEAVSLQHPLAGVEIVAWDSTLTLVISKEEDIILDFMRAFPRSRDLSEYNAESV